MNYVALALHNKNMKTFLIQQLI